METVILVLAGLIGGFIGSEVGAGALITLPVLLFLGLPPAAAVATNIVSAWLINVVATADYWRARKLQPRIIWHLGPPALVGAVLGSEIIIHMDQRMASAIIAVLFLFIFLVLFALLRKGKVGLRAGSSAFSVFQKFFAGAFAFGLGVYGGFFAVGVTTLFVIMLVYVLRRDFIQAAADSVAISSIFLLGALITFFVSGLIDISAAWPLALGSVVGAHIGARTATRLGNTWIKHLAMGMVIIVVGRLVYQLLTGDGTMLACELFNAWCDVTSS